MDDKIQITPWICLAMMRLGTRMATEFDHRFEKSGITQAQFRILLTIWDKGGSGGIAPSILADYLMIERGTVSVLTSRMVDRGWLSRQPGQNRRTYQLILTEAGSQLLQEVRPKAIGLAEHTLSGIPLAELLQMRASLERIETRLREYTPPE